MTDDITLTAEEAAELRQGFNYCPRCGTPMVSKHVYGRLRRVCTECRFIQFIDPKVSAAVMVVRGGKVLLLQRAMNPGRDTWCFPGGFMEIDETPQEAAIRECKEESGLDIKITKLVDVFYYEDYRGGGVVIMYAGQVVGGTLKARSDEAKAIDFFGPDDLPEPIEFDSNLETLDRWVHGKI
jgi:ADP-ribose pyrophosphatase YjhB (NUDIX family)